MLADHQGSKIPFREFRWIGPYAIEKVLPNENYILRKINSNKTQTLHRIQLRKYTPNTILQDNRPEKYLQADNEFFIPQADLYIVSWETHFDNFIFLPMPAQKTHPTSILLNLTNGTL